MASRPVPVELLAHLRRARDHIDRHYAQPLNLDRLAAVAGVSKYHLVRCFEATYGETPMRYLTRRRIERAQDLLRAANLTVTEICMMVGFASLGSFSSRFRQLVGESPTAYRDRWAARGAPHVPGCYLFMRGVFDLTGTAGLGTDTDTGTDTGTNTDAYTGTSTDPCTGTGDGTVTDGDHHPRPRSTPVSIAQSGRSTGPAGPPTVEP